MAFQIKRVHSSLHQGPLGRQQDSGAEESQVSDCALAEKPFRLPEPYCMFASRTEVLSRKHHAEASK